VDGVNGLLFGPFSADSLRAALQRLLLDPALCHRLAAASPPVKTIAADAAEWQARYVSLRREHVGTGGPAAPESWAVAARASGGHL
jgi:hypothetical protein